jgi:DNA topoisomerase I
MAAAVSRSTARLLRGLGLRQAAPTALTIRRRRRGKRFVYVRANRRTVSDPATLDRLRRLAVPPAYEDVLFAEDPQAHVQAIGRDAAGRLQYRYHPDWLIVRERRKARRLRRLMAVMPKLRRALNRHLVKPSSSRECVLAAVVHLVTRSAIRAGSEDYVRAHGTRGATTLLKSNLELRRDRIVLRFKGKLGKLVCKEICSRRLVRAFRVLLRLPGSRLFQFRDAEGKIRRVQRDQVNAFLRELAGVPISLKDFRTLAACELALVRLSEVAPSRSQRGRRRQVREALQAAADELGNTPAICRKSYVHESLLSAFEEGKVAAVAPQIRNGRSNRSRHTVLAKLLENS